MSARVFVVAVAAAMALFGAAEPADACSPVPWPCRPDVVPTVNVPANTPGFWWRSQHFEVDPTSVTLSRRGDDGQLTPVAVTVDKDKQQVHPSSELLPGVYVLTIGGACSQGGSGSTELFPTPITVVPPAPLPDTLGPLVVSPLIRETISVAGGGGSCSTSLDAVYVSAAVSPTMLSGPWGRMLNYDVYVDGEYWRYSETLAPAFKGWLHPPESILYHACEDHMRKQASSGLAAGEHVIVFRGQVPGTDTWISSEPVTVDLQCSPSGCGVGSSGRGGWLLAVALAILGLARARERRRRPPQRH